MQSFFNSINEIRLLDNLSKKDTPIHKINPLILLLTTIIFIVVVISFDKYTISQLFPLLFYPVFIFIFAEIPFLKILKRLLNIELLIVFIAFFNIFFDQSKIVFLGIQIPKGYLIFFSIILKSSLTIISAFLLVSTTGIEKIAKALRLLKIPKIFVLQLLLTYRFIFLMLEEAFIMVRAYFLRAPCQKSIKIKHTGSFIGHLLIKTYKKAVNVYNAMCLRGFNGDYNNVASTKISVIDLSFFALFSIYFVFCRFYNISNLFARLFWRGI